MIMLMIYNKTILIAGKLRLSIFLKSNVYNNDHCSIQYSSLKNNGNLVKCYFKNLSVYI